MNKNQMINYRKFYEIYVILTKHTYTQRNKRNINTIT